MRVRVGRGHEPEDVSDFLKLGKTRSFWKERSPADTLIMDFYIQNAHAMNLWCFRLLSL